MKTYLVVLTLMLAAWLGANNVGWNGDSPPAPLPHSTCSGPTTFVSETAGTWVNECPETER